MAKKFGILRVDCCISPEKYVPIVHSLLVLHNFLINTSTQEEEGEIYSMNFRKNYLGIANTVMNEEAALRRLNENDEIDADGALRDGNAVRAKLMDYFQNEGFLEFQVGRDDNMA